MRFNLIFQNIVHLLSLRLSFWLFQIVPSFRGFALGMIDLKKNGDGKLACLEFEDMYKICLLYTSPSPRDKRQSRMPSSA